VAPELAEILKRALELPSEARAALAGSLLESLDETIDESAEQAWSLEIARRMNDLDSDNAKTVPWAEVRRQISALLNER
jgi:putative addiction module component (TIGR02574 family)